MNGKRLSPQRTQREAESEGGRPRSWPSRSVSSVLSVSSVVKAVVWVCAVSAAACSDAGGAAKVADVATFKVQLRDLRAVISEKGTLKAANQVLVRAEIPGQAKIVSLVEEGTQVKEGDVICELDRTEKVKEVGDLENRVIQLQGEVTAAEAELAIQLSQNEADIRDAALKHHLAELELDRYEKGEFIQEKTKREVRVEEAKSELDRATRKYDQMPGLLKEGFVTPEQVEEERIKRVKAQSEVLLARLDVETFLTYGAPKDREQKQADLHNTALEMDRAKQRAAAREAQKRASGERQRSEMSNVKDTLEKAKEVLAKLTIRAPGPGIVIYGDARNPWDDRQVKVGEMVYAGQPFVTLPDLSEMQVVVAIHEADISRVATGLKAFVVVESSNETSVEGEVTKVAPVAASGGRRWMDDTKRFNVEISLRGDITTMKLKPGLTARVEIQTGEKKGVLAVPLQAVFAQRGQFYVFKRDGKSATRTEVQIEEGNSQFSVVKSGLAEGDEVLLYNPEATDGAAPAPTEAPSAPPAAGKPARGKP